MTIVRILRLSLFIRIAAGSNVVVKAVPFAAIGSQNSWMDEVERDFNWIKILSSACTNDLFQGIANLREEIPHILEVSRRWKKWVKDFCLSPAANRYCTHIAAPRFACFDDVLSCPLCPKVFPRLQQ